jgi:hypothetical protein
MRTFILIAAAAAALTAAGAPARAGDPPGIGFFSSAGDLPLMPGMTENVDEAVVFDQPGGRIVEVAGTLPTGTPSSAVTAFYDQTLPQLGWRQDGPAAYVRERERLVIQFGTQTGGPLRVRLAIQPAPAAVPAGNPVP